MSNHTSPFAALTGAEKQIRWLEYQSIRLPLALLIPDMQNSHFTLSQNSVNLLSERKRAPNNKAQKEQTN